MQEATVSVLIPAYNEAERIAKTVCAVKAIPEVKEIIVVDDGSRDLTGPVAIRAGAFVIQLGRNHGKGDAVNIGLSYVQGDVVLLLDADLGDSAYYGRRLLGPILSDEADLVIAAFPKGEKKSGFGIVEGFARCVLRYLGKVELQSPLSGQRAIRTELLRKIGGVAPGFGMEVAMTLGVLRSGGRVVEIEVPMSHRKTGRNWAGFIHRGQQLLHILSALWYVYRRPTDFGKTKSKEAKHQSLREG